MLRPAALRTLALCALGKRTLHARHAVNLRCALSSSAATDRPPLMPKPPVMKTVLEPPHPADAIDKGLLDLCEQSHTRGSGAGGQHRNKVSTGVKLKHTPTGESVSATDSRSQQQNLSAAAFRLRLRLALNHRLERPPEPSALWRSRTTKKGQMSVNEKHADFPALLAEALDHTWQCGGVLSLTAATLGVSTSQLRKFLAKEPQAMQRVNALQLSLGLKRPPGQPAAGLDGKSQTSDDRASPGEVCAAGGDTVSTTFECN